MSKKTITIIAVILGVTTVIFAVLFTLEATNIISIFGNVEQTSELNDKSDKNGSDTDNADNTENLMDTEGGSVIVYYADAENPTDEQMDSVLKMLKTRLDGLGYTEAQITNPSENIIEVKIPSLADPQEVIPSLGETAKLEFMDTKGNVVLTGNDVKTATTQYGELTEFGAAEYYVEITLTPEGREKFKKATENAAALKSTGENYIAIAMDGTIISMPYVHETIDSSVCVISGDFDEPVAKSFAAAIRSGQLPFSLKLIEQRTVSPAEK